MPASIQSATVSEAPELMPNTYGPANGFRKRICRINPEIDKVLPAMIAVMVFGQRICQNIKSDDGIDVRLSLSLPP